MAENINTLNKTIAFMTRGVHTAVGMEIWRGIQHAATKHEVNVITLDGGTLGKSGSIIYELISRERIAGVITWASSNLEHIEYYEKKLAGIPLVAITLPVPGRPVVKIDSYNIMRMAMLHLLKDHGYHKIVFIRGNDDNNYFRDRFRAFEDVYRELNIPIDRRLISKPYTFKDPITDARLAREAISELLDTEKLVPGKDFQALLSVTENTTMTAVRFLKAKGVKIPQEIAYISHDNSLKGLAEKPKPTAMISSYSDQAERAFDLLIRKIAGHDVPMETNLSGHLEINESCGCKMNALTLAEYNPGQNSLRKSREFNFETFKQECLTRILDHYDSILYLSDKYKQVIRSAMEGLITAFIDDIDNSSKHSFEMEINNLLEDFLRMNIKINSLHDVISLIRQGFLPYAGKSERIFAAENLFATARILVAEGMALHKNIALSESEKNFTTLRNFLQVISAIFDINELFNQLDRWLPLIKINHFCLVRYENVDSYIFGDPLPAQSRLVYATRNGERADLPAEGMLFDSRDLLPPAFQNLKQGTQQYIIPLVFVNIQIGYGVITDGPANSYLYSTLAGQLSNSLQGSRLIKDRLTAKQVLEDTLNNLKHKAGIVSSNTQTISSGIEDISQTMEKIAANIHEISSRISSVMEITNTAVSMTDNAREIINKLHEETEQITEITKLISDIAERTDILSINATIESTRAGKSGRGFSIVAKEIKKLASATSESTRSINEMIANVQNGSTEAKEIIQKIVDIIKRINNLSRDITASIGHHAGSTSDISRKLSEAAAGSHEIFEAISEVASDQS